MTISPPTGSSGRTRRELYISGQLIEPLDVHLRDLKFTSPY